MAPRWKKIIRDLFVNRSRTIVVVLAIAVGVVAFGGVFTTQSLLLRDMSTQYKAINPGSLTLTISDGFDESLLTWIESQKGVLATRASAETLVRIYTPSGSRNLILYAYNDITNIRVNKITPVSGTWPPKRKDLILERTSAGILPYNLGETIEVENSNGRKKLLTFSGTVHDLRAVPANLFPQLTGYISFDTLRNLDASDNLTTIEIQTTPDITTLEQVQALGNDLKTQLENRGYTNVSASSEKPNQHWGQDVMNAFVTILMVIGSFSLILSIFLVYNTVSAIIVQQKKQIGIMKAIGSRNSQIFSLFIAMAAGYGILATLVAIPLGALMAYGILTFIAGFLNLDVLAFTIPLPILLIEISASLGVPIIAALIPVILGTKITVREAISDFSVVKESKSLFDRILNGIKFLSRPVTISLRNTFRQKSRLALTLLTLTIAGTLFVSVIAVRTSMLKEADKMMKLYSYDLELYFGGSYNAKKAIADSFKSPGVTAVETPTYLSTEWQKGTNVKTQNLTLLGLPPDSKFVIPTLLSGRWINANDTSKVLLSNRLTNDNPNLEVGQYMPLKINDTIYQMEIIGIYQSGGDPSSGIVNEKFINIIYPDQGISSVRIQTEKHDSAYLANFANTFEQDMKHRGYSVAYSLTIDTIKSANKGEFDILVGFLLFMAGLVAVVGALGLAGTMSLNVLERTREIGVMRSIGASNNTVFKLVVTESLIVGWISALIAIPLSIPMGIGFCYALGTAFFRRPLNFEFSVIGVVLWVLIVSIISILASIAPAKNAVNLTVKDTLSYE